MQVTEYKTAAEFLDATRDKLMENEIGNAILLGYATNQSNGVPSAMSTHFYSVDENDKPILPAMFTPEIVPLLSQGPDEAARLFARYLFSNNPRIKGVNGHKETTLAFADEWERLTRCNLEIHMNGRLHICDSVNNLEYADGTATLATPDDTDLILRWRHGFREDARVHGAVDEAQTLERINAGKYYLWTTDKPVSMAMKGSETENSGMIGAVFTPEEHRNHGYATAVTAALTRIILDSGKKYASLYTDLDNPISNSIYQQIGYKPIMDSISWLFTPAI